jgi:hypothetical protein
MAGSALERRCKRCANAIADWQVDCTNSVGEQSSASRLGPCGRRRANSLGDHRQLRMRWPRGTLPGSSRTDPGRRWGKSGRRTCCGGHGWIDRSFLPRSVARQLSPASHVIRCLRAPLAVAVVRYLRWGSGTEVPSLTVDAILSDAGSRCRSIARSTQEVCRGAAAPRSIRRIRRDGFVLCDQASPEGVGRTNARFVQ